jgi:carbonic anhydrase
MSTIPDFRPNADDALQRLKAGNARFVAGTASFPKMQKEILAKLTKGQNPYATILSCSDSRVPPELIFDASLGELFIIRVAEMSPEIGGVCNMPGGICTRLFSSCLATRIAAP